MRVFESKPTFDLPDEWVAVCGDWHANVGWLGVVAPAISRMMPEITTVLQLGDWWTDAEYTDPIFTGASISRVLITLGNHEPWDEISPLLGARPGEAVRVSEVSWLLPRPFRFRIGERKVLSLGGATSVDRAWRTEGRDWWPDEAITDQQVAAAIAGGPADVLVTHESPDGTPVREVQQVLRENPGGFPDAALRESAESRQHVTQVWDAVRPELLLHGHMHVAGSGRTADGRAAVSVGRDAAHGNVVFLHLPTLITIPPSLRELLDAAGRQW